MALEGNLEPFIQGLIKVTASVQHNVIQLGFSKPKVRLMDDLAIKLLQFQGLRVLLSSHRCEIRVFRCFFFLYEAFTDCYSQVFPDS